VGITLACTNFTIRKIFYWEGGESFAKLVNSPGKNPGQSCEFQPTITAPFRQTHCTNLKP
jgi:hypothetical protein